MIRFFLGLLLGIVPAQAGPLSGIDGLSGGADVVILGEVHDNPQHHANQAEAVMRIGPVALVFEMLSPEQAETAHRADRLDAAGLETALGWNASGWPDFAMYHPIFAAAPEATIYGAALPRDRVRQAMSDGAEAVFGADLPSVSDEQQRAREALQASAHCDALPETMLPGMVEAQRLRDAALAQATARALTETGGPVVVITGNGHARTDWGIPVYLAQMAPDAQVLSLGQLEGAPTTPSDTWPPYDNWIVTEAAVRDDPCAAFR